MFFCLSSSVLYIAPDSTAKVWIAASVLAALMAMNIQVGMNDGSTTDISLLGLEASVFAPAAVATANDCHKNGECEALYETGYTACTYMNCGSGTQLCHKE
ncbi:MAG TPA: hypothetical protein VK966_05570 [Longimicrobiales bacterium]|nr:hypothetical protein [Longimicrobiales bacterium]